MATLFALLLLVSVILLPAGLIAPKLVSRLFRKNLSRKALSGYFGSAIVVFFVALALTVPKVPHTEIGVDDPSQGPTISPITPTTEPDLQPQPTTGTPRAAQTTTQSPIAPTLTPPTNTPTTVPTTEYFLVTRVVDGDTLDVSINGKVVRLRLIGVDTPETVDPRKPVQCFGKEASRQTTQRLLNQMVRLEADPTQGDLDKYSRLLRYVFTGEGPSHNQWLIENGYAHEYTYSKPYKYQQDFKNSQKRAREQKLGLWADDACAPTAEPPVEHKTETPSTAVTTPPPTTQNCSIKGNINSQGDKIYHLTGCGSYKNTVIDESAGERWFCSEQDALNAGWRKAGNC